MTRFPRVWVSPLGLNRRVDKIFNEFMTDWPETSTFGRTDVFEKDGSLHFETELAGATKEDINIKVDDGHLIISGETKRSEEINEENYFRMGRRVGTFQRTFPLPEQASDPQKIQASFENGILKVTVPLNQSIKEKEQPVEIKVG